MPFNDSPMSEAQCRLSGDDVRAMFSAATRLLERNVDSINALNVFPVPDGDTGTNMFLTLRDVTEQAGPASGAPVGDVASAMAHDTYNAAEIAQAQGKPGSALLRFYQVRTYWTDTPRHSPSPVFRQSSRLPSSSLLPAASRKVSRVDLPAS